ncbi:helix-turn-helix domain-containing protein [Nocardioides sp. MH1]|uniref:helix-turn-helix domain-containing protein n=1 Tax=Nocardioides sp. MH1 TaxID=3242490 RepID=UPI00351F87CD
MSTPSSHPDADRLPQPTSLADYRARADAAPETWSPPSADVTELLTRFGRAADAQEPAAVYHRVVASVLARAPRLTDEHGVGWTRYVGLLERHGTNPKAAVNCGVLSNLVGIAAFGDALDFVALAGLADRLGSPRLAAVQHRTARFVEPDPTFPLTTVAIRRMVGAAGHPVAARSIDAAAALLLEGVEPDEFLPLVRTRAELLGLIDTGSVLEWRHHLAMIAANPWSPYAAHLAGLADQVDRPQAGLAIERAADLCRGQHREREREQVAEQVRRLVEASGVSQRQFAQWAGTSPSRLSTYLSGAVTPAATLMLRMTRTSRLLRERDVTVAPPPESEPSWGAARTPVDGGTTDPAERVPGTLGRRRSHLSAV